MFKVQKKVAIKKPTKISDIKTAEYGFGCLVLKVNGNSVKSLWRHRNPMNGEIEYQNEMYKDKWYKTITEAKQDTLKEVLKNGWWK
jgi:hypothetical protein